MAKITWTDRTDNTPPTNEVSASIFNETKESVNSLYNLITGSQTLTGSIKISGSIIPDVKVGSTVSTFNLGSPTSAWNELYVSEGSLNFVSGSITSSFSKTELDALQSGRTIATASRGGNAAGTWLEFDALFSQEDEGTFIRTIQNRIAFAPGIAYLLDLDGTANEVIIGQGIPFIGNTTTKIYGDVILSGSLKIRANSPGIINQGSIALDYQDNNSAGIFLNYPLAAGTASIMEYDSPSSQTFFQFAEDGIISGSFGMAQGKNSKATFYSHAEGFGTETVAPIDGDPVPNQEWGGYSHAEGNGTKTKRHYSHAEGIDCITSGSTLGGQHAEGRTTEAWGNAAHSEGAGTKAYGEISHAEGANSVALGIGSHAEGLFTIASGSTQHTQGKYNTHGNDTSLMIIGNGVSDVSRSDLALFNSNAITLNASITASNDISASGALWAAIPEDTNLSGSNVVVYDPTTGQFLYTGSYFSGSGAGGVDDDWGISPDNLNVTSSRNVIITGSLNQGNENNTTPGVYSHAQGYSVISLGNYSHAEGISTIARGETSHAEGSNTYTLGVSSHTEGQYTTSSGNFSHAEGQFTHAKGTYSHAEGYQTHASHSFTHAEGFQTLAQGRVSHAEGYLTTASGNFSHANGIQTISTGEASFTTGYDTKAVDNWSFAAGSGSRAYGTGSFTTGNQSISQRDYQTVIGKFNRYGDVDGIGKTDEALFVIGNGVSDGGRKNIMVINTASIFIDALGLPTVDPEITGQLFRQGTVLHVSLG